MRDQASPDLPPPHVGSTFDEWAYRWPTGTEKCELMDGVPVFYGEFDERDVEIAQRTYPGRRIVLRDGVLEIHPGEPGQA